MPAEHPELQSFAPLSHCKVSRAKRSPGIELIHPALRCDGGEGFPPSYKQCQLLPNTAHSPIVFLC